MSEKILKFAQRVNEAVPELSVDALIEMWEKIDKTMIQSQLVKTVIQSQLVNIRFLRVRMRIPNVRQK